MNLLTMSFVRLSILIMASIAPLIVASPVKAQAGVTWAADALIGGAHIGGGDFYGRLTSEERIAASVRKELRHGAGVDAEVGYDWLGNLRIDDRSCNVVIVGGGCLPNSPSMGGLSGLVGVSVDTSNPYNDVEIRVNAGMAEYSVGNTRLGAPVAAIDVALITPASWLGVVFGGRAFMLPNYHGDRLTTTTFHVGVRLRSGN